jgi:hypothetical protein
VLLFTIGDLDADGFGLLVGDTVLEREPIGVGDTGSIWATGDSEGDMVIGETLADTVIIEETLGDIIGDAIIIGEALGDIIGDILRDNIGGTLVDTVIIGDIEAEILFIALPAWLNILSIP